MIMHGLTETQARTLLLLEAADRRSQLKKFSKMHLHFFTFHLFLSKNLSMLLTVLKSGLNTNGPETRDKSLWVSVSE